MERRYHAKNGRIYLIDERFDYKLGPKGELALRCVLSANQEGVRGRPTVIEVAENEVPELAEERPDMTEEKKKNVLLSAAIGKLEERLGRLQ